MFTLSTTCKNKGRRHSIHLQWTICEEASGAFWRSYTNYASTTAGLFCGYIIAVCISLLWKLLDFILIKSRGWKRHWWAKGDILPWGRPISSWKNEVWGYYWSHQEYWWGLFCMLFVYISSCLVSLLDKDIATWCNHGLRYRRKLLSFHENWQNRSGFVSSPKTNWL
jgi:hypothetical protein